MHYNGIQQRSTVWYNWLYQFHTSFDGFLSSLAAFLVFFFFLFFRSSSLSLSLSLDEDEELEELELESPPLIWKCREWNTVEMLQKVKYCGNVAKSLTMGATTAVGFGADLRWDLSGSRFKTVEFEKHARKSWSDFALQWRCDVSSLFLPEVLCDSSQADAGEEVDGEPV